MSDFAGALRALMDERGISTSALARQVPCDRALICRYRSGKQNSSAKMARRIDEVLGAHGELAALAPTPMPGRRAVLVGGLLVGGALGIGSEALARLAWAERHPPLVDMATVESLAAMLAAQRHVEDSMGTVAVRQPVLAQLAVIEDLVRQARGPARMALVDVAQQWAQFAAYLHRDAGDNDGDRARLAQALEWATETGDRTMASTVLVNRGRMALRASELGTAIGLAQAAQRDKVIPAGQRAYAATLEAQAQAAAGDAAAAERKIAESAELAVDMAAQPRGHRPWLYWMSPQFFRCAGGVAYTLLAADPRYRERAIAELEAGYADLADEQKPSAWATRNLACLADVHATAGDVGQACAVALQAAAVARRTGSVLLAGMLVRLHARLASQWPREPAVADLAEALR